MNNFLGLTGLELALSDHNQTKKENPLLMEMSCSKSEYMKALMQFKHKTLVSGTHFDYVVPFCSSAILSKNSFPIPN